LVGWEREHGGDVDEADEAQHAFEARAGAGVKKEEVGRRG